MPRLCHLLHSGPVLLEVSRSLFALALFLDVFGFDLHGLRSRQLFQSLRLQPSLVRVHLVLDLLDAGPVVIECVKQACANLTVDVLRVQPGHWQAVVVPKEAILQSE